MRASRSYSAPERKQALAEIAASSVAKVSAARGIPKSTLKTWKVEAVGVTRGARMQSVITTVCEDAPITAHGVAIALAIDTRRASDVLGYCCRTGRLRRMRGTPARYVPSLKTLRLRELQDANATISLKR